MRCANCGSTNVTVETQPTSGFNLYGTLVVKTDKTCHCMACGRIGTYSYVVMDSDTEFMINNDLNNNNVARLQNFKRKYRNLEWNPPSSANNEQCPAEKTSNPFNNPDFEITPSGSLKKYNGIKDTVVIPYGVKNIEGCAFLNFFKVASITIPGSVTSIARMAFSGLEYLTSVEFSGGNVSSWYSNQDNSVIEEAAFERCRNLKSIAIPNRFTKIGKAAFSGCYCLTSVTLPNSLKSIEDKTFWCCFDLTSIVIPNSVTSIGKLAFCGCDNLKSITIPSGVVSIGDSAFSGCKQFETITIPRSVTNIGDKAFEGCKKLKTIYFEDPYGWRLTKKEGGPESVDEKILSNPKSAAKYIKKYCCSTLQKYKKS